MRMMRVGAAMLYLFVLALEIAVTGSVSAQTPYPVIADRGLVPVVNTYSGTVTIGSSGQEVTGGPATGVTYRERRTTLQAVNGVWLHYVNWQNELDGHTFAEATPRNPILIKASIEYNGTTTP